MGRFFLGLGIVLAVITWLWTSVGMFLYYGLLWALIAFFFPPADLIAMFLVGTWPIGLAAVGAWVVGSFVESKREGNS
jgi:hypothetical protein